MFLRFPGSTDMESWARDYGVEVTAGAEGAAVAATGGNLCQHTDDLLAVTITGRWVSSRQKLMAAGCVVVQDGDREGTVSFDPNDTEASLAVLRSLRLK